MPTRVGPAIPTRSVRPEGHADMATRGSGVLVGGALAVLALAAASGCRPTLGVDDTVLLVIEFDAEVAAGVPATCGALAPSLGTSASAATLTDLRLYLSNFAAHADDGSVRPLEVPARDAWQGDGLVLLDFEDGTGPCAEFGTPETHREVMLRFPRGDWTGLSFDVGVPFELNHLDLASAEAPLDVSGMYWSWAQGYKFARVEWEVDGVGPWLFHLGSAGCDSEGAAAPPEAACARPNRAQIQIDDIGWIEERIVLDLDAWFGQADLASNVEGTAPGCMSGFGEDEDCAGPVGALGLDVASGACVGDCLGQTVFSSR